MVSLRRLVPMQALLLTTKGKILLLVLAVLLFVYPALATKPIGTPFIAKDPGVRGGPADAGGPINDLTQAELAFFNAGLDQFEEVQSVRGTIPNTSPGLGPRFNLDSCGGCHAQPVTGGTSPSLNPQVAVATKEGAKNIVPFFITPDGPVR